MIIHALIILIIKNMKTINMINAISIYLLVAILLQYFIVVINSMKITLMPHNKN